MDDGVWYAGKDTVDCGVVKPHVLDPEGKEDGDVSKIVFDVEDVVACPGKNVGELDPDDEGTITCELLDVEGIIVGVLLDEAGDMTELDVV